LLTENSVATFKSQAFKVAKYLVFCVKSFQVCLNSAHSLAAVRMQQRHTNNKFKSYS